MLYAQGECMELRTALKASGGARDRSQNSRPRTHDPQQQEHEQRDSWQAVRTLHMRKIVTWAKSV